MEPGRGASLTDIMRGAGGVAAAFPSRASGNIPYAGGMTSGKIGGPPTAPLPPQTTAPAPPGMSTPAAGPPASGGPPAPSGGPAQPSGLQAAMAGPAQQSPYLDPMFYFDFMASLMSALQRAADSEGGIY